MSNCKTNNQIGGLRFSVKKRRGSTYVRGKRKSSKKYHRKRSHKRGGSNQLASLELKSNKKLKEVDREGKGILHEGLSSLTDAVGNVGSFAKNLKTSMGFNGGRKHRRSKKR